MKIILISSQWNEKYETGLGNCSNTHYNLLKKNHEVIKVGLSNYCDYNLFNKFYLLSNWLFLPFEIFKILKKEKPDLVIVESLQTIINEIFLIITFFFKIKTCIISHGISLMPNKKNLVFIIKLSLSVLYLPILFFIIYKIDYFLTLDKESQYHRYLDTNIYKLLNGEKNLFVFNNTSKFEKFENKKKIFNKDKNYIVSIGYINSLKNQLDQLILAKKIDQSFRILIVYSFLDQNYYTYLQKFIKKNKILNVEFIQQNKVNLEEIILNSEFVINTSKTEVVPLTLIETISLRKIFLSYDVGSIKKIKGGIVNKNFDLLLHNVNVLLKNKNLKKKLEQAAFEDYEKNFKNINLQITFDLFLNDVYKTLQINEKS
jgi:hypothetical protein